MDKLEQGIIEQENGKHERHNRMNVYGSLYRAIDATRVMGSSSGLARIIVIIAAVVVVLAVAGGVSAYYLVSGPLSHPHEETAKLMSPETDIYFSLNLRPGVDQLNKFRGVLSKFTEQPGFEEKSDGWMDEMQAEMGIDLKSDVFPWLGPEVAVGATDIGEDVRVLVLVGTTDIGASQKVFEKWLVFREKDLDVDFNEDTYRDFTTYSSESLIEWAMEEHYTLTDEYIVFSNDLELLKDTIDRIKSPATSLADNEDFQEARQSAPGERVSFLYVDMDDIYEQAGEDFEVPIDGLLSGMSNQLPESIVMSTSFVDNGLRMDFITEMPSGFAPMAGSKETRSAEMLPDDTLALFYIGSLERLWEQVTNALNSQGGLFGGYEEGLGLLEQAFGYDLEKDILSWMTGEMSIALLPSQIDIDPNGEMEGIFEVAVLIESSDTEATEDVLKDVVRDLERTGFDFDQRSINGHDVTLLGGESLGGGYSVCFAILGDFLVIGSTRDAIATVIDIFDAHESSLAEDDMYRKIQDELHGSTVGMFYLDASGVKDMVLSLLEPSERATYDSNISLFVEPLKRIVMAWDVTGDESRQTVIITVQ